MRTLALCLLLAISLTVAGVPSAGAQDATDRPNACVGTIAEEPDRQTIVSIQGSRVTSEGAFKTPALLVSFAPDGSYAWAQNSSANGRWWAYDVDPLDDGNLLYATTEPGISVVGEFDPERGEYERVKRFEGDPDDETTPLVTDAHDADLLGEHEMAMVDKGEGHERLLVYNLTSDRVAWEWRFGNHPAAFPDSGGGPPDDWTHVNDVEQVREDLFMLSVRNFDQVVFVNRTTDDIERTLGADDAYDVLKEQHNPDHLWGPNGEHTVLVADSLNDRVVEYRYRASEESWERVWSVGGFDEPRDVDRLQNGNTLVADRRGHRVLEITPQGEAVWEVYTPYEPYDVERGDVDESTGPTMAEQSIEGQYDLSDDAGFSTAEVETCAADIFGFASPSLSPGGIDSFTTSEGTASGEDGPAGSDTGEDPRQELPLLPTIIAAVVLLVLLVGWRWRQ